MDAVRNGRFHVWEVSSVDQALELLTGLPAGAPDEKGEMPEDSVNFRIAAGLQKLARMRHEFAHPKSTRPPHPEKRHRE